MQSTISSFHRFFFPNPHFSPKIRLCARSRVFRFYHTIKYGVWKMLRHKTFMLQFLWSLAQKLAIWFNSTYTFSELYILIEEAWIAVSYLLATTLLGRDSCMCVSVINGLSTRNWRMRDSRSICFKISKTWKRICSQLQVLFHPWHCHYWN